MIKNRFLLRILGLVAFSGITLLTALPEATAQIRPNSSGGQDFFCDRGTQVNGFPFNLFAWDAIPWGIERKEFLDRYKEQIKECDWEVDKKGQEVFARYRDPEAHQIWHRDEERVVAQVKFYFYGEDKTLSRIEIYDIRNISLVALHLFEQFGEPQNLVFMSNSTLINFPEQIIYKGTWFLQTTKARAISSWHLVFEPLEIKDNL